MVIVGSQRMVQYDDTAADESVRVFDRGMEFKEPANFGEHQLSYRSGDIVIPRVDAAEPLSLELEDFAHAIRTGATPRSHAELGYEIVDVIEAAEESLRRNGQPVMLGGTPPASPPERTPESEGQEPEPQRLGPLATDVSPAVRQRHAGLLPLGTSSREEDAVWSRPDGPACEREAPERVPVSAAVSGPGGSADGRQTSTCHRAPKRGHPERSGGSAPRAPRSIGKQDGPGRLPRIRRRAQPAGAGELGPGSAPHHRAKPADPHGHARSPTGWGTAARRSSAAAA